MRKVKYSNRPRGFGSSRKKKMIRLGLDAFNNEVTFRTIKDFFGKSIAHLPSPSIERLEYISKRDGVPVSRLIAIAVHNELVSKQPFEIDFTPPNEAKEEDLEGDETRQLLEFIKLFGIRGVHVHFVPMFRTLVGIKTLKRIEEVYRALQETGLIEEFSASLIKRNDKTMKVRAIDYDKNGQRLTGPLSELRVQNEQEEE